MVEIDWFSIRWRRDGDNETYSVSHGDGVLELLETNGSL